MKNYERADFQCKYVSTIYCNTRSKSGDFITIYMRDHQFGDLQGCVTFVIMQMSPFHKYDDIKNVIAREAADELRKEHK